MRDESLKPAVLTLEMNDQKITIEMPGDVPIGDMITAFYGACVTATWQPVTILEYMKMKRFAEEKLEALGVPQE
jgi:hypothetical protein